VQEYRLYGDELLALEPVEENSGRFAEVYFSELLLDQVEAFYCAAIV
jgi:hypothetical protein